MMPEPQSVMPVRYQNGEIQLAVTDLTSGGFGTEFGHTRIYSNRLGDDLDYGNGYNWLVRQLPKLLSQSSTTIMVLYGSQSSMWFDLVGSAWVGRYGTKFTLTQAPGVFKLAAPNGEIVTFNDFSSVNAGLFKSKTTAGGQVIRVVKYNPTSLLGINELHRSYTTGGVKTIESWLYRSQGLDLTSVVVRRSVGGGPWEPVRRALYSYYSKKSTHGQDGDLKTATVQSWNGTAWQTIDRHYYRYWKHTAGGIGLPHGLKYVLNSAAYDRMTAASLNPLAVTDAVLANYADLYLEYDSDRYVTLESVNGGLYSYGFSFTTNTNPHYVDGYNNWKTKAVETRPDSSVNTVYSNYVGRVMLKQLANGAGKWIEASQYNDRADATLYAYPSAVASFDDSQLDLAIVFNATSGLIRTYDYFPGPAAPGYMQAEYVQQGSAGTPVLLKEYDYGLHTAAGATVYPTKKVTVYRDDAATQPIETNYAFTFFPNSTAVKQRTTTWPIVPTSQNGSGLAESRLEEFDLWGNTVSITDERGVVTQFTVDTVTGGTLQRVDDAIGMALVSDFTLDSIGRTTQALGPSHTIDLGGMATLVRPATWWVYQDNIDQVWTAQGYATGTSPSYSFTLVNPVSITISDGDGNLTDQIQAIRSSTSGPLSPADSFPQSSYCRWTHNAWNDNDQLTATLVYFAIPASGSGTRGTNYNETDFSFDAMGRQNRVSNGGQTITRTVHDPRNLALSIWIGTNDTGATDNDPSGGGAPGNNMVAITINQYDSGATSGDGNLTLQIKPVDSNSANDRDTGFSYDWRNRQVQINAAEDYYQLKTFDTLNRVVQVNQYSHATDLRIRRGATNYDNRGRVYERLRYSVDPNTGTLGNVLTDNFWFDPAGNQLMSLPAGSDVFTKSVFDALNRETVEYVGFYSGAVGYAQAVDISGATIVEQTETTWDEASNSIQSTTRQRFHNATGLSSLTYPGGAQPQARVTYTAIYSDGIGRTRAVADYGTNGDSSFARSATIPASSPTCLVTVTLFNERGEPYQAVDPMGTVTQTTLDDLGRRIELIQNYQAGAPSTGDTNVTAQWTYSADNLIASMTALNAATGNQTTAFNYGTLTGSDVARNDVLSSTVYADGGTVSYLVNRQSEPKQLTDQNGTVHAYSHDLLGRQIYDSVTTLGTGVDGSVLSIGWTYEVRGMLAHVTSYSDSAHTTVVNDALRVYNSFEQCVNEYQEHNGVVNISTSVVVAYQFADGSVNTTRQTGLVYPNGRTITLDYGVTGGIDDAISRVENLIDDDGTTLVTYTRIGAGRFVMQRSQEPQIAWSLINGTGIDPYTGLDQFNRIVDDRWYSMATDTDLDRIQYGYDLAGNRLYRKNTVAEAAGVHLDELYTQDRLYRLARLDRGQLNSTNSGVVSGTESFTQAWTLDATGNWSTFNQADAGGSWTLEQTRTANAVNEITGVSGGSWAMPAYDAAGNTIQMPQPSAPSTASQATYDAWNRVIAVSSGGSMMQQCSYDGMNRQVTGLVAAALRHYYFSVEWQWLEERLDSSTSADRQFVCGLRYIDDLILRDCSDFTPPSAVRVP